MIATPTFPDLSALVVDESLYIRRIVRDMLMRVGIKRVLEAPDGAEALGVLAHGPDGTGAVSAHATFVHGCSSKTSRS